MATHHRRRRSRRHSRIDQFPDLPNGQLGERIALGLFILHLIIMMAIVSLDLAKLLGQKESTPMLLFIALKQYPVIWLLLIPVPVIFGVLATFVWQAMVRIAAVRTLRITTLLSLILPIVASIIIALFRQWHLLVITILLFFVISFSATRWWKSILYASVMLREVNSVAIRRVGLWMTTVVVSLLLAGYTLLCYSVLTIATTVQSSKILSFFVLIFVFLSFLWTFRITIHFIRLVATRVFAACYWPTKSDLPSSHLSQAIHHSLAHAIKFGGALCYGSLFPTIYPNGFACRRTGVLARMAAFHDYTFVYVAVVGKCFYPSGWESRTLIHTRRMSSAYNQSATSGLLLAAVAAISIILTYAIRFVIFYATSLSSSPIDDATLGSRSGEAAARLLALFVALIAVITVFVAMEIARTGVLTLLMSIAVDPSHFRYDHNDFWDAFSAVYPDFDRLNVPISKNIRSSYIPSVIIELTRPKPAVVTNHY
ncbi:hypothetical protein BDF19DRAFT_413696 [Syncephalis fuscata]|nr:hypothetical protein BDF19DRAFT_413696 [Syncephalis fuscata]